MRLLAGRLSQLTRPSFRLPFGSHLRSAFRVTRQRRAYRNLAYALVTLPLALVYLVIVGAGTATGVALLPTLLGLPILAGTVAAWWWFGDAERLIASRWLDVTIPPITRPRAAAGRPGPRWWRTATAYLGSAQTWMTLGYLLLKLPFGVVTFVVVGGFSLLAVGLLASPVPFVFGALDGSLSFVDAALLAAALFAGGWVAWAIALHAANAAAWTAAALTRLLLGQGDTTQRLEVATATAERELARAESAERSRQELIVNVGHELRTPTATIRGHVESLLLGLDGAGGEPPPTPDTLRHHLEIVQRETHRLGTLIDELLTLARADSGELTLALEPVAVGDVVEDVYQSVAPLARRERKVTVTRGVERGLPHALADRQRLVQVLLNLVRNAVAYTPEGGIVAVTAERGDDATVAFSVIDTGAGIPPDDLPHIFERFYRADPSRARASGGFGLGLAIVRDLVKAMGGSVDVESVVGEGTRFRVLLPSAP